MSNKYRNALRDVTSIIHSNDNTGYYSDEEVLGSIRSFLDDFIFNEKKGKSTWKLRDNPTFKYDVAILGPHKLAEKYDISYQGAMYHIDKYKLKNKIN